MDAVESADLEATTEIAELRTRVAELEQSLDRRTREMVALHEISLEIDRQPNLATLLRAIVEKAAGLLNARMGGLYLMQPEGETLELVVGHNLPEGSLGITLKLGEGVSGRVAQTGQLIIVPDYRFWEGRAKVYKGTPFRRVVGVPLKRGDKIIGVINIFDDDRSGFFDEDEIRLVCLFADQAAIAVDKVRLWEEAQREIAERSRAEQIQASLYRISEAAHAAPSLDELYRSIHAIVADLMPAHNFGIALYDPSTDLFSFPYRVDEHYPGDITPPPRRSGKTFVDYVWQTGTPLLATMDQLQQLITTEQLQPVGVLAVDWLGVPLKWQDKPIGVMVVQTYTAGERLTEEHKQILTFVSTQVVMAIQRKRAEQRQTSLYRISEAALAARSLDDLYALIHQIVNELMPARNFFMALYDAATDTVSFPYFKDEIETEGPGPSRQHGRGLTEYVLRLGKPWLATKAMTLDLLARGLVGEAMVGPLAIDWLGVPLKADGKTIGLIAVQSYSDRVRLTDEHKDLLLFVSTQVAMAIQRKRAEQRQASIYRISEAALAAHSLNELYRLIHEIVNELMPAKNLYIALYDEATDLINFPYLVDERDNSTPLQKPGKGLTAYVLRTGQPLLATPDVFEDMRRRGEVELIGGPSIDWLGVPLNIQQKTIGVLAVQTYSKDVRLTDEHKDLLVFVSTQVAMVIQRKQAEEALRDSEQRYHDLFDAAQRQAQELALIDRVRTALTRELDLDALFRTVVTAITETFGYTLVSLYILEGDDLVLQHQIGYEYVLDRISIASGVTGRVVRTGRAVFLEDVQTEPAFLMAMDGLVSEVCVPLTDQGRVVGVLNVESARGVHLTEADLRLMTVLAEHVSIAISQARLYTEARENAARLTAAFESLPFDFWVTDRAGRYVMQNSRNIRKWGNRIGQHFMETNIDASILRHWSAQHERVLSGEMFDAETRYADEAEPRWYYEIVAPVRNGDRIDGMLGVSVDVTDRHRATAALRASEARLRAVLSNIPVILVAFDLTGTFIFAEGKGLEVLNIAPERLVGSSVFERVHQVPRVTEAVELALSGETLDAVFEVGALSFGVWLSPMISVSGEMDGVIGVAVDVTEREHIAKALRDSEERYRMMFESNPHPMWAYDLETLAFLAVNDAAVKHYGFSREEFLHMTIADIRPPEDVPALLTTLASTTETVNLSGVWRHRKKDGTLIDVEISSHTLTLDGRPARIVLANDVTEHRRAEEALRRAQKMESLGVLAGGIAHDFNNLLVAMLGQTSLALGQLPAGSPARHPIEKAVSAARRAADLTRQLLAYSGRGQFERRPIQLNRLIQENLHLFEVAVPKNVLLRSELTEPLPIIMGDAGQIQQVVMNLIINAAEAIGERPGQVVVRTRPYLLTPDKAALWQLGEADLTSLPYVLLAVEDNGCGMSQETSSKIFDPFFSTKFTGRGLGLAAVLGIVRGHEGGLRVESDLNVGTTFELVFPSENVIAPETIPPELVQEADMLHQLILVIDDEEPVRGAVTDILDLEGLSVLTARDGQTGIDLYRARQAEIDLIMLDLSMPGLTGEETFRELRQINPQVRIMLSSGYSHDEVTSRFAGQREVAFIQKPYDASQLVTEVKRQLALPRG